MASGKNFRQEKRMPTCYVMATAVVFVAFCLIGAWVLSSPSESRAAEGSQNTSVDVKENVKSKSDVGSNESFEDIAGDLTLENEEKAEETPQQQTEIKKESSEAVTEQKAEEPIEKKESKKSSKKTKVEEKESDEIKSDVTDSEDVSSNEDVAAKPENNIDFDSSGGKQSEILTETKETSDSWETQVSESKKEKEKVEQEEKEKQDDQAVEDDSDDETTVRSSKKSKKKSATQDVEENEDPDETAVSSKNSKKKTAASDMEDDDDTDEIATSSKRSKTKASTQEGGGIRQKKQIDWTLCELNGATDYIPCLDNVKAIKALPSTKHYEHRERHCPDQAPTCLVPFPEGYRRPIRWPQSRNEVWYANVPHPGLVSYKKDQNWVKKTNDRLIFPGGGTQFKHGALHYIDYLEQSFPKIAWGKRTRVILDVGCGVASFGGYIFDRDVLTMSFAPKDEHEAQVQLALERGIPAISSVMGTQRLVFPSNVFDAVHCARCRVPWHIEGGKLLLELNRVLRPGGYFVWSATPVYWTGEEDVEIWKAMVKLTNAMCWKLVAKFVDESTAIGAAVFQKPTSNYCYENRKKDFPPMCDEDDKPDAAWYVPMTACIHKIPDEDERGAEWPQEWPLRLTESPAWLSNQKGVYGKTAAADFRVDTEHWQRAVQKSYLRGLGIEWKNIRNVMDMRAVYGGFAAALSSLPVWVMNVVPSDAADTLPVIFDRGLFGMYHDWCEAFNSYPRTYDLLHVDHLFGKLKKRCKLKGVIAEVDRLLRPGGWVVVRDKSEFVSEVQDYFESLQWEIRMTFSKGTEGLVAVQKTKWRPESSF
ncbi:hypothetical protein GOP47_0011353 [Adiantum capillus-veneris]|uniref:Methyltransferase n=1 Tax=Adiantum capillus-veneris TaxID=13818 RepID=A0A9D4UT31_ADICA|nr:hypothetical protein GOP47_0011353 [Adiantum capillus-veneris]